MHRPRRGAHVRDKRYEVYNLTGLLRLLAELEDGAGSQVKAARRLGITQGHYSKLCRGRPDRPAVGAGPLRVSRQIVGRLQLLFGDRVWDVFVSPGAKQRLAQYHAWLGSHNFPPYEPPGSPHSQVARALHKRGVSELLSAFLDDMGARRHEDRRYLWAYMRVLDRFLDSDRTGGVERSIGEMTDRELRTYLKAALTCERILLNRPPDVQRAQALDRAAPR